MGRLKELVSNVSEGSKSSSGVDAFTIRSEGRQAKTALHLPQTPFCLDCWQKVLPSVKGKSSFPSYQPFQEMASTITQSLALVKIRSTQVDNQNQLSQLLW